MWDDNEISTLIRLWEENLPELSKLRRDRKVLIAIAKKLQKVLKRDVPFTHEEVRMKLYILRKQYNKNKRKQLDLKYKPTWRFFSKIDKFSRKLYQGSSLNAMEHSDDKCLIEENVDENEVDKMNDSEDSIIRERGRWSDKEITTLIDLWEEYLPELCKPGKSTHIFVEMAKRLQNTLKRDPPFTYKDVQMKLYILKKQYSRNKKRHKDVSGNTPSWKYFLKIYKFLEQSDYVLSSSSLPKSESIKNDIVAHEKTVIHNAHDGTVIVRTSNGEIARLLKARSKWGDRELSALIDLWEEYLPEFRKPGKLDCQIFIDIAKKLQKRLKLDDPFTYKDIKVKLLNLKKQYSQIKRRRKYDCTSTSLGRYSERICKFYDHIPFNEDSLDNNSQNESDLMSSPSKASSETSFVNTNDKTDVSESNPAFEIMDRDINESLSVFRERIFWSDKEISTLIHLWEEYLPELRGPRKNKLIFIEMAHRLQKILKKDIPFTYKDIEVKLIILKKQYNTNKRRLLKPDCNPPTWRFFQRIHSFCDEPPQNDSYIHWTCHEGSGSYQKLSSLPTDLESLNAQYGSSASDEVPFPASEEIVTDTVVNSNILAFNKNYNSVWTKEDISALIDVWEESCPALQFPGKKTQVFIEMSKKLQTILKKDIPFTYQDIQIKLNTLKNQYRALKKKYEESVSDSSIVTPSWQFFSRIHEFYGRVSSTEKDSQSLCQSKSFTAFPEDSTTVDELRPEEEPVDTSEKIVHEEVDIHQGAEIINEKYKWNEDEISALIDLWGENVSALRSPGRNLQIFLEMAKRLQKTLNKEVPFTYRDIQTKLYSLKSQYGTNKRKQIKDDSRSPTWQFFSRIDKFYRQKPENDNSFLRGSQTDLDVPSIQLTSVESEREETNLLDYGDSSVDQKNFVINEIEFSETLNAHSEVNIWTADETTILIDLWEEYLPMLLWPKKSTQALFEMAKTLQKILKRKNPFTFRDIEAKLDSLKNQYRTSKRNLKKNGRNLEVWHFFPRIHKFYSQVSLSEDSLIQDSPQTYYNRSPSPALDSAGENDTIMSDEVSFDTPEQVVITFEEQTSEMNKSLEQMAHSSPTRMFRNAIEIEKEASNLENLKLKKKMYEKMLELLEKQIEREEQRKIEKEEREERLKLEKEQRAEQLRKEIQEKEERLRKEKEEREEQRRREWEAKSLELITLQKEQMDNLLELLSQNLQSKKSDDKMD